MSRRYSDLDDLIHDLDASESLTDDPFGIADFDDDDLALLGSVSPEPRARRAPAKRLAKPRRRKS
jgi:hypothetical protein